MDVSEPFGTLVAWIEEARAAGIPEPDAMTLATVNAAGVPTARVVSLRRAEADTLIFTSALWTRKARDLQENPVAALVFFWPTLGRQVQVSGRVEPAERALAEDAFATRDRPHQLQSLVSRQGAAIEDLAPLRQRLARAAREIGDAAIECPADWGAFRVHAEVIEYWRAAPDALHDRLVLVRERGAWRSTRVAP
jgi:pyridoxamine 5'-phosphate oxidase